MLTFLAIYVVALVLAAPLLVNQFTDIAKAIDKLGRHWVDGARSIHQMIGGRLPRRTPVQQRIERLERDLGIGD